MVMLGMVRKTIETQKKSERNARLWPLFSVSYSRKVGLHILIEPFWLSVSL